MTCKNSVASNRNSALQKFALTSVILGLSIGMSTGIIGCTPQHAPTTNPDSLSTTEPSDNVMDVQDNSPPETSTPEASSQQPAPTTDQASAAQSPVVQTPTQSNQTPSAPVQTASAQPIAPVVTPAPAPAPNPAPSAEGAADKSDDDDLATLQNAKVQLPAKIRLGVVHWTSAMAKSAPEDIVFTDPDMQKEIAGHLKAGARITDVVFIPGWMTQGLKVGAMRTIAARCNVDVLLVYDDSCTVSSLGTGEPIVGSCSAEAILLDGKTGLIPATFSAAGDHSAAAPPRDVDPNPERNGVAQRASLEAVNKIADAAARQLNAMP